MDTRSRLRLRILIPLVLGLVGLVVAGDLIFGLYLRDQVAMRLDEHQQLFAQLFQEEQADSVVLMRSVAVALGQDRRLRTALRHGDRERLAELTRKVFASLREEGQVSHMYYLDSQGRVLLGLHRPEIHGDRIERPSLREAQRTGQTASGLGLGPLGHMMLRVVVPWREEEQILGFVELGVDIDQILDKSARELGEIVVVLLSKAYLEPDQWTASHPNAPIPWDTFPDKVLYRVINTLVSPGLVNSLRQRAGNDRLQSAEVDLTGHRLRLTSVPIGDVQGREVAEAVVLVDVTGLIAAAGRIEGIAAGVSLALVVGVFSVLYRLSGQAERGCEDAIRELGDARSRLEDRVERRTQAVAQSQARLAEARRIARLGNWEWDRASGRVAWSDELYRIFGLDASGTQPAIGPFLAALQTHDRERVRRQIRAFIRRGLVRLTLEGQIVLPTGATRFVLGHVSAERGTNGRISRFYGTIQDITERRRTEASLERTNRALTVVRACDEALVRAVSEAQLLADICRVVVQAGGYRFAWIGYPEHDSGKTVHPLAHYGVDRDDLAGLMASWANDERGGDPTGTAIRTGRPIVVEDILTDPRFEPWRATARSRGYASSLALPIRIGESIAGTLNIYSSAPDDFDSQKIRLLSGLAEDLSFGILNLRSRAHLERANRALQLAKEHLQSLYDTSPDMIFLHACDGRILDVNRQVVQTLGFNREELLGQGLASFMGSGDCGAEAVVDRIRRTLIKGFQTFEWMVRRKDGVEFPVEVRLRHLDSPGPQEAARVIAVVRDITERKRIERDLEAQRVHLEFVAAERTRELQERSRALERSEAFYRAVVEDQTELICRFRPDGALSFVNDAYCRYFSRSREELIGRSFMSLIPEDDRELASANIAGLSPEQSVAEVDYRVILPDGAEHWLHWSDRAIFDDAGRLEEYQGVGRDISISKRSEKELRLQAKELEILNRELGAFSYSVSHDLRAPLRAIDGFSQALVEDYGERLDETGRDYLMRVRRASQRMGELIDDLLVLARVSRREMRTERVDLSMISMEVVAELRLADPDRDISFRAAPGVRVQGDSQLLKIVLENLLANAWKYTGPRARAVVELETVVKGGETFIYIRDNGVGFDPAYAAKLFQPFQRLHRTDEFEGTGIGLATVARIVHRHGGRVWAEGTPDQGASVYFTIPEPIESKTFT